MIPFRYERAQSMADATRLAAGDGAASFLAGGTDKLQLLKDHIEGPRRLIDITGIAGLDRIEAGPQGLRLGALAKMSDVADHPSVRQDYPVISQALLASASPQIRNMATIGGNVLQRSRCVYFRDPAMPCNKRDPGSGCAALSGDNRFNAILGGSDHCVAQHSSDLAVALVALDARLVTSQAEGQRQIPLQSVYLLPGSTPDRETVLDPGELIVGIEIPASPVTARSLYLKLRDRASFEFALVSAAVALDIAGGTIRAARVALGGVGTKPWRSPEAEQVLTGATPGAAVFAAAAKAALSGAKPLEHNRYKVQLAQRVLARALATLGA